MKLDLYKEEDDGFNLASNMVLTVDCMHTYKCWYILCKCAFDHQFVDNLF